MINYIGLIGSWQWKHWGYSPPPRRSGGRSGNRSRSRRDGRRDDRRDDRRPDPKKKAFEEKRIPPPAVRGPDKPQITEDGATAEWWVDDVLGLSHWNIREELGPWVFFFGIWLFVWIILIECWYGILERHLQQFGGTTSQQCGVQWPLLCSFGLYPSESGWRVGRAEDSHSDAIWLGGGRHYRWCAWRRSEATHLWHGFCGGREWQGIPHSQGDTARSSWDDLGL